jgi:hypothetical protein
MNPMNNNQGSRIKDMHKQVTVYFKVLDDTDEDKFMESIIARSDGTNTDEQEQYLMSKIVSADGTPPQD